MAGGSYEFRVRVWLYPGMAGWHFVTVPKKHGKGIRASYGGSARGWGSLPVAATVGGTTWKTSIFPDKDSGSYVLPVKASVRKAEGIEAGDLVQVHIQIGG